MSVGLGHFELQLFACIQSRGLRELTSGSFVNALGWTDDRERKVLSRLACKGLIVRVRPGLYLAPDRLPPGGRWSPGQFAALDALMRDREAVYQISGPNAFHRYGWIDQVPIRLYVYNNRISGERSIGAVELTLIRVANDRLGGVQTARSPEGIEVPYASKARALVDAVQEWSRFDTLPRAYDWIRGEVADDEALPSRLAESSIAFANQGTKRRIGALLERLDAPRGLLRRLESGINPSNSLIPWIPVRPKQGIACKRWGVVFNDE